jgi:NADH:ubiquinone oxidoreductase subunit 3 (subunit A)
MVQGLLLPPIAFIVVFCVAWLLMRLLSRLALRSKSTPAGQGESYACGEKDYNHLAQPDYSTFFPFAFFFTLAHVATLIMTTVPVGDIGTMILAILYITSAAVGLYILFRR